jgi:hypothetical protein
MLRQEKKNLKIMHLVNINISNNMETIMLHDLLLILSLKQIQNRLLI